MQKFSKLFLILGIVVGILVVGGFIGWLAGGSGTKKPPLSVNPAVTETQPGAATHPPANPAGSDPVKTQATPDNEAMPPTVLAAGILTNWEEKVDEILGSQTDDTNKVEQLFALFPHVPAESRSEVAQHLSNLVSDDGYAPLGALLKNPTLGDDALDVLMADVLNRPNSLKLPELLNVAQTPDHPKADEAKDILSLFLDEDFGTDWPKWNEKMTQWLKDNPD